MAATSALRELLQAVDGMLEKSPLSLIRVKQKMEEEEKWEGGRNPIAVCLEMCFLSSHNMKQNLEDKRRRTLSSSFPYERAS